MNILVARHIHMAYIIYTVEKIEKEKDITALLIFSNHMKKLDLSGPGVF